jgi:hypothetical protein
MEIKIEHVFLFLMIAFVLYHFSGNKVEGMDTNPFHPYHPKSPTCEPTFNKYCGNFKKTDSNKCMSECEDFQSYLKGGKCVSNDIIGLCEKNYKPPAPPIKPEPPPPPPPGTPPPPPPPCSSYSNRESCTEDGGVSCTWNGDSCINSKPFACEKYLYETYCPTTEGCQWLGPRDPKNGSGGCSTKDDTNCPIYTGSKECLEEDKCVWVAKKNQCIKKPTSVPLTPYTCHGRTAEQECAGNDPYIPPINSAGFMIDPCTWVRSGDETACKVNLDYTSAVACGEGIQGSDPQLCNMSKVCKWDRKSGTCIGNMGANLNDDDYR